jgi:hypothetical protein
LPIQGKTVEELEAQRDQLLKQIDEAEARGESRSDLRGVAMQLTLKIESRKRIRDRPNNDVG